ncbi:MAG: polyribonucleotide nucleotidyltransferase [Prevotellaceae bacterium]|jgi:polyribonucleotide nucleotidyltransferase|nr:polyribonucleotide nucleotidyltransferase [Prevotellaceae bacterium]
MNVITKTVRMADGKEITLETGKLAKQADGAVMVTMGKTMLLATVCSAKEAKPDVDFMPLSVDYKEKFGSIGRFPGGFFRREGRPSDYEVLISRLVDRALRPLFPDDFHSETFVNITLHSADGVDVPDALAGLAASAALAVSDVPFNGPISEVRVARIDGEFVINPTFEQLENADLELIVAATIDNIMMVEGEMKEVSEDVLLEAIKVAHEAIIPQCQAQIEMMKELGKEVKREYCHEVIDEDLKKDIWAKTYDKAYAIAVSGNTDKHARSDAFAEIEKEYIAAIPEEEQAEKAGLIKKYYHGVEKEAMRRAILDEGKRLDGRKTTEIRPIWAEAGYLPGPHGSAVFTRGETQSLTSVTLGTKLDEKIIDEALITGNDRFLLHYNFPPFSTGDARPSRGVSRREVGHGNLALRALKPVIPENYDYCIRVVSDILESNGSSSMATVCASTLALMDAGVPIKKPVSGIAMGLISENKGKNYAVLSDILGDEDHLGDMDFKVTGTRDGITATQMDIKVDGLSYEILEDALRQAKEGREHILGKITDTLAEPRADLKPHAPRLVRITIPKDMIGAVIGPQGKIIQAIQAETGTVISIEEIDDLGIVEIASASQDGIQEALARVKTIITVPEVGNVYHATIKSIMPYGCFVEILPGKEGLLHITEIDYKKFDTMEETGLKEENHIDVKLVDIDKTGKFRLSARILKEKPTDWIEPEPKPRPQRSDRDRGRNDRNSGNDRGGAGRGRDSRRR